jgi:flagellar hook-associated protein FlgK
MPSTFSGIEAMRRALLTQQTVMNVIGQNVANATTAGYSRQRVDLAATTSYTTNAGQVGTGVEISSITRIVDEYVNEQLRTGTATKGALDIEKTTLEQIENAFVDSSNEQGFSTTLSSFFDAWQTLSENPEDTAARNEVISTAQSLKDVIVSTDQTLRDIRVDLNTQLKGDVGEVNRILNEIATLNPKITQAYALGNAPNSLLDNRDQLLNELAQYVNYSTTTTEDEGGLIIDIGGRVLLGNDNTVYELNYDMSWDHPSQSTETPYMNDVSQNDYNMLAQFSTGELKGIIESRDVILTGVQDSFTGLVTTMVDSINNLQSQGIGLTVDDTGTYGTTLSDITNMNNCVQISASETKNFNIGDKIFIEDADGESLILTINDIDIDSNTGNGRLFFDGVGILEKSVTDGGAGYTTVRFSNNGIDSGATIKKITTEKNNFFEVAETLDESLVGDTTPTFTSQMTSTITLPDSVTLKTTVKQLESILGVDITDTINGLRLNIDDNSFTDPITDNMTLDRVFSLIENVYPMSNDGSSIDITLDTVNHKIVMTGTTKDALSQIGGEAGSENPLFTILGFEGYGITGFELPAGTELSSTLEDIGVSDGYVQIDNVVIEIANKTTNTVATTTLQSALDNINAALNKDPSQKSYGTRVFYDSSANKLRIVSPHQFTVSTPKVSQFPPLGTSAATSNFLTGLGFQGSEDAPTYSAVQELASVTSSDIGARLTISKNLLNDSDNVAASSSSAGVPGDNSIALAIAKVDNTYLQNDTSDGKTSNPTQTLDDFFNDLIAQIGSKAEKATSDGDVNDTFLEYYQNKREEVSGVSIDEEMTNMIEAQQSFNAASRMVTVINDMLDLVINQTFA